MIHHRVIQPAHRLHCYIVRQLFLRPAKRQADLTMTELVMDAVLLAIMLMLSAHLLYDIFTMHGPAEHNASAPVCQSTKLNDRSID